MNISLQVSRDALEIGISRSAASQSTRIVSVSVYCFAIRMYKKQENLNILKNANGEESHLAYKEWAFSIELLQQNINRIIHPKINGRATINLNIY